MTGPAVLDQASFESDTAALLDIIHAAIPPVVGFTAEHPAIRDYLDARQLTGTNRVGAMFKALSATGHIHPIGYRPAGRAKANGHVIRVWEWT